METFRSSQEYWNTTEAATLDRIERLVKLGAEVRLGKRRMHVIHKDDDGMAKIACDISAWDAYKASGRPMPKHMRSGLR